ncbi:MAG TPA: hypothetical protein VGI50_15045 [Solirubrobacteraceae bacterium]|jgi:hypothetical protein
MSPIAEAVRALQAAGEAAIPASLASRFLRMPDAFAVRYWRRVLAGPRGELWFAAHSRAAPEEMASLARVLLATVRRSKHPSPDLDDLLALTSGSFSSPAGRRLLNVTDRSGIGALAGPAAT